MIKRKNNLIKKKKVTKKNLKMEMMNQIYCKKISQYVNADVTKKKKIKRMKKKKKRMKKRKKRKKRRVEKKKKKYRKF